MKNFIKKSTIVIILLLICEKNSFAQPFFKDYAKYLTEKSAGKMNEIKAKHWISAYLMKFKSTFDTVQYKNRVHMLNCDTLYMFSTYDESSYEIKWLIWNRKHSCFYRYNAADDKKLKKSKIIIEETATQKLRKLQPGLIKIIESADTSGFFSYVQKNPIADHQYISFVVAIRHHKKWRFLSSDSYGTTPLKDRS